MSTYIPFDPANGAKNETGNVYKYLTVLGVVGKMSGAWVWECRCVCGKLARVRGSDLRRGLQTSCGCMKGSNKTHGMYRTPTWYSWAGMKERCDNPNHIGAANYSERGISYDPEWAEFANFYRDMGERPNGLTLERIDNDKGYSRDNCKWATRSEQRANQRPRKRNK